MADEIDAAQAREEQFRESALAAARAHPPAVKGRDNCIDCRDPISPERKRAIPWAQRCTGCQSVFEAHMKTGR